MIYVTLLDQFHPGIYSSQVIDVCNFIAKKNKVRVRLVAFLSIREIKEAKPKIKALYPDSMVLPAAPGLANFKYTSLLLALYCLFTGERIAICRNVFATTIGLKVKSWGLLKRIIYDGRSAINAEIKEYDVFPVPYLRNNISNIEANAVLNSDYRMAVSNKLVEYWRTNYKYNGQKHVVINCTLDSKYFNKQLNFSDSFVVDNREKMGFKKDDIIFIYSGSTAPWQSFKLMRDSLLPFLKKNASVKIIFLSRVSGEIELFREEFPNQVFNYYVSQEETLKYLTISDYGVLIREQSETNAVAAPVKFAEYLYAGLPIIISENLGDYSDFVKANKCGNVYNSELALQKTTRQQRLHSHELALKHFFKESAITDNVVNSILGVHEN